MPQLPANWGPIPLQVTLDGSGNGTVTFQPNGTDARVKNLYVMVSTQTAQAVVTIYRGQLNIPLATIPSGSTGGSATGNIDLRDGEILYIVWTGGDAGATAKATLTGNLLPFGEYDSDTGINVATYTAASDGTLIFPALKSVNYVPGSSGWIIKRDGTFELGSGTFRGTVDIFDTINPYRYTISPSLGAVVRNVPDNSQLLKLIPAGIAIYPALPTPGGNATAQNASVSLNSISSGTNEYLNTLLFSPGVNGKRRLLLALDSEIAGGDGANFTPRLTVSDSPGSIFFTASPLNAHAFGYLSAGPDDTDVGMGIRANTESSSNSGGVGTSETVVLSASSITYRANRAYRIRCAARYSQTTATAQTVTAGFRKTNLAGMSLSNTPRFLQLPASSFTYFGYVEAKFTVGNADVTAVIVMTLTGSAANTLVQQGGRSFEIEDIGPASLYTVEPVLV